MDIAELYRYTGLSYKEFVTHLLEKYGPATDDYYKEKSYNKFLKGEIKTPAKGKYSRTGEGLVTHHINEDKYYAVSQSEFIQRFQYPFMLQKKECLVYANLIEHTWLHVLIARETHYRFGLPGLKVYLLPDIENYYIRGYIPQVKWRLNVYNEAYLSKEDAQNFVEFVHKQLPLSKDNPSPEEKFNGLFPNLVKAGMKFSISRERILKKLYKSSYQQAFPDYEKFKESKINTLRDGLLLELDKLYEEE